MRASIVPIGNSKGIRIPKTLLELCHIHSAVDIDVKGDTLVIHPVKHLPRADWTEAFQKMHERREDRLLVDDSIDLDLGSWDW